MGPWGAELAPWERALGMLVNVATHVGIVPVVCVLRRSGRTYEGIIAATTCGCSLLYHATEIAGTRLFFMTTENWHRLDNVFVNVALVTLCLFFMHNNPKVNELLQWMFIVVVTMFQEQSPWSALNGIIPFAAAAVLCAAKFLYQRQIPRWFLGHPSFWKGVASIAVGEVFFIRGLDESSDYLRIQHSVWHLFTCLAALYFFGVPLPEDSPHSTALPT